MWLGRMKTGNLSTYYRLGQKEKEEEENLGYIGKNTWTNQ